MVRSRPFFDEILTSTQCTRSSRGFSDSCLRSYVRPSLIYATCVSAHKRVQLPRFYKVTSLTRPQLWVTTRSKSPSRQELGFGQEFWDADRNVKKTASPSSITPAFAMVPLAGWVQPYQGANGARTQVANLFPMFPRRHAEECRIPKRQKSRPIYMYWETHLRRLRQSKQPGIATDRTRRMVHTILALTTLVLGDMGATALLSVEYQHFERAGWKKEQTHL
ncbi:hypothetical protein WG66_009219 [Moniliophthora roreri]|nr:hypothetical protein WG66_009219 [Moniliophthora roreri]